MHNKSFWGVAEESIMIHNRFNNNYEIMDKRCFVYILASKKNGTLYVGVTSNLEKRIWEHKSESIEWFTKKYHVHNLVWFQKFSNIEEAIEREKHLKGKTRQKKIALIEENNPEWHDFWEDICHSEA